MDAASVLVKTLPKLTALRVADFGDIIAGRHTDEALQVLELVCTHLKGLPVTSVDLSDNALGTRGISAIARSGLVKDLKSLEELVRVYPLPDGFPSQSPLPPASLSLLRPLPCLFSPSSVSLLSSCAVCHSHRSHLSRRSYPPHSLRSHPSPSASASAAAVQQRAFRGRVH